MITLDEKKSVGQDWDSMGEVKDKVPAFASTWFQGLVKCDCKAFVFLSFASLSIEMTNWTFVEVSAQGPQLIVACRHHGMFEQGIRSRSPAHRRMQTSWHV